jgi:coatomer protein complex subunit alpha (xenin)
LLTVTKGFFELLAAKGRAEAAAGAKGSAGGAGTAAINAIAGGLEDGALEGAGWGEEDLDLGGGGGGGEEEGAEGDEEGGWDMEDLEISPEVMAAAAASGGAGGTSGGPFVVPPAGTPAAQKWLEKRTQLAADHIAAGSFQSAMSLLFRQIGATSFEPLRPLFLDIYSASHASTPGLPGMPSMLSHLDR